MTGHAILMRELTSAVASHALPGLVQITKKKGPMSFPRDLVSTAYSSATLARPRLTIFGSLPPRIAHELLAGPTKFGGLAPTASLSFFFETWDLVSKVISIACATHSTSVVVVVSERRGNGAGTRGQPRSKRVNRSRASALPRT
jgi:hypothetical protein